MIVSYLYNVKMYRGVPGFKNNVKMYPAEVRAAGRKDLGRAQSYIKEKM